MNSMTATIISVIADTFSVDEDDITRNTIAADVDGWDSLSHTVLMIRLEKRLGIRINERIAFKANSVGMLIDAICDESAGYKTT